MKMKKNACNIFTSCFLEQWKGRVVLCISMGQLPGVKESRLLDLKCFAYEYFEWIRNRRE